MRIKLISLVEDEKMSTAEAGRIVGIKQTSACRIINSYKKHNRIFEKKADRIVREKNLRSQMPLENNEDYFKNEKPGKSHEEKKHEKDEERKVKVIHQEERHTDLASPTFSSYSSHNSYSIPLPYNFSFNAGIPYQHPWQAQWAYPCPYFL